MSPAHPREPRVVIIGAEIVDTTEGQPAGGAPNRADPAFPR